MVDGKRSDYIGLYFMPESSYGVDPGIVGAAVVNGTSEAYRFVPDSTYKAWVKLAEKPSGMPKLPLVDVPQIYATHDYDTCKVKGIKDTGEFSISMHIHGPVTDFGTTGNTGRTQPPPWLHLAGSACGFLLGSKTGQPGGGTAAEIATGTDSDTFTVSSGTVDEGFVLAVDGPGGSTALEIIRPTTVASSTSVSSSVYNGVTWGFTDTPLATEKVYYACQGAFDKRFEGVSESFTLLLQRADNNASIKFTGARCSGVEITSKVGELPMIKLSFIYRDYAYVNDQIDDEPDYVSTFPCPAVTQGAKLWITWDENADGIVDASDRKENMEVSSFNLKWTPGYVRRKASTASDGIAEVICSQKSEFEVSFETLYNQDWQDYLGLCCNENFANLALAYWEPNDDFVRTSATATRKGAWFAFVTNAHQIEDPGSEGEMDSIMYQTIRLACGNYTGDNGSFSTSAHVDTKWLIGVV
jgi:hypothetical protein